MFSNIMVIYRLFIVTIIFTTIVLPFGAVFSSEIPEALENQVVFQSQGENHPNLTSGGDHLSINGETGVPSLSQELRVWEEALPDNLMENVPGPGAFFGTMLKKLSTFSMQSDDRIKKLINGIPQVFPDLNQVLVAL